MDLECKSCRKAIGKGPQQCGICDDWVCRSCQVFVEEGTFSFLRELPPELEHRYYCGHCHQTSVQPALEEYEATMLTAKEVFFFYEGRKNVIPVIRKSRKVAEVKACLDRNETILRLGFIAAQDGFNAVIDAVVDHEKKRDASGYQTTEWQGTGWPALVDRDRLERRERNGYE